MSVNFFKNACAESPRTDKLIGICDDQEGEKAYTSVVDPEEWVAKVNNENEIPITFTPIDNCIIVLKDGTTNKESTCDGMITYPNNLYLLELKDQGVGGWISTAKNQLENTIKLLNAFHNLENIRFKKAYACNKKHPNFTVIDSSEKKSFFERTNGFRLDIQTNIIIK